LILNKIVSFFSLFVVELLIIISLLFVVNNFIGQHDDHIGFADGVGYYDYLPSSFIRHDINRKDVKFSDSSSIYYATNKTGIYKKYKDFTINKYTCGTAILQSPFFFLAYFSTTRTDEITDGYQNEFQIAIYISTIFYLFLGLIFFRKTLNLYKTKRSIIIWIQLLIVFSTSVIHYTANESAMSHVYSFFAISLFIYVCKLFFTKKKISYFIIACGLLGFIFLLRQVNILVLFSLPFLAGSWADFKFGVELVFKNRKGLIFGIICFGLFVSFQFGFWYLQTGEFIIYSYQNEGFDFHQPAFFELLFSYQKGLFVYAPVLFLSVIASVVMILKKEYYLSLTWILFLLFINFVFSSWHDWGYGCSYGARPFIDYYSLLFIPFSIVINRMSKIVVLPVFLVTCFLSILTVTQTYQYKNYILHWVNMNKEMYWSVFMETDEQFNGVLWRKSVDETDYHLIKNFSIGEVSFQYNEELILLEITPSDSINFDGMNLLSISFQSDFDREMTTKIHISIDDSTQNYFWHERPLLHFYTEKLGKYQEGKYNFSFPTIENSFSKSIVISIVKPGDKITLAELRIKFLKKE